MRFTAFPNEYLRSQVMSKSKAFSKQHLPETELIYRLFSSEVVNEEIQLYPWNPAELEAEAYYIAQEKEFNMDDWSVAELQQSSDSFFTKLGACWPNQDLLQTLCQKFAARIPQEWLEKVAAEATKVAATAADRAGNQLVSCVRELLPAWEEDDLLVLARPYSYAMRCDPAPADLDNLARSIEWSELSATEQAKLTMLASKYALEQLDKN
jgi:hypothetical protein